MAQKSYTYSLLHPCPVRFVLFTLSKKVKISVPCYACTVRPIKCIAWQGHNCPFNLIYLSWHWLFPPFVLTCWRWGHINWIFCAGLTRAAKAGSILYVVHAHTRIFFFRDFFGIFSFYVRYSTLLHLAPLRFPCGGGCWDRNQDCCDFGIGMQPDALTTRLDLIHKLNHIHTGIIPVADWRKNTSTLEAWRKDNILESWKF